MKRKITFLLLTVFATVLSAQTVNIEGDPYGGNPYPGIQVAIDASNSGDVILISGTFTISAPLAIPDKSITLRGSDPLTDIIQAGATAGSGTSRVISLFQPASQAVTFNVENLGIKNGNSTSLGITRGGGIYIDGNYNGLVTITNCIIEGNVGNEGGAIASLGTDLNIIDCTIKDNTGTGGGGLLVTANDNNSDMEINISKSLFTGNTGTNGGGIYINGNNGSSSTIDVNIENSTFTLNSATSGSGGAGGGAVWGKARNNDSNVNLELVHVTVENNSHASAVKNGFSFTGGGTAFSNVSIYNSIITNGDDIAQKAFNWPKAKPLEIINSILGGSNAAGSPVDGVTANDFLDDVAKNNQKGRTATQAGLTGSLTDVGGNTEVIVIGENSAADDFCTVSTGISLPTIDQRGFTREGAPDAGAYEFGGTLSIPELTLEQSAKIYPNPAQEIVYIEGIDNIEVLRFYSILGTLDKVIYNQSQADVSDLAEGMYLLSIETSDNKKLTRRLVIK